MAELWAQHVLLRCHQPLPQPRRQTVPCPVCIYHPRRTPPLTVVFGMVDIMLQILVCICLIAVKVKYLSSLFIVCADMEA